MARENSIPCLGRDGGLGNKMIYIASLYGTSPARLFTPGTVPTNSSRLFHLIHSPCKVEIHCYLSVQRPNSATSKNSHLPQSRLSPVVRGRRDATMRFSASTVVSATLFESCLAVALPRASTPGRSLIARQERPEIIYPDPPEGASPTYWQDLCPPYTGKRVHLPVTDHSVGAQFKLQLNNVVRSLTNLC